jgi:rod shape-determining protein MreD
MLQGVIKYSIIFTSLVLIQVLVLNQVQFSGFVNPYIYLLFIMLMPLSTPQYVLLPLAFLLGLTIDIFSNSLGVHAAATTFIAFMRPVIIRIISNRDEDKNDYPGLNQNGIQWFLFYTIGMVFLHHFILFYLEIFSFAGFFHTLFKIILSLFFSVFVIVLSQYIIFRD